MRGAGGERVIIALLSSAPRLKARTYIAVLPTLIFRKAKEEQTASYTSDALKILTENTAKYAGGSYMNTRLEDILNQKPQDNRTAEEIAADVIQRAGLTLKKRGEKPQNGCF